MNAETKIAAGTNTGGLILFFDTETTGLPLFTQPSDDPGQPHVVQLAAELCTRDGAVVESYQAIVNIGEQIPADMTAIHGITNERMEAEGILPRKLLSDFFALVDRADEVVGHNVSFDLRMMRIQSARHLGEKWECPKPTFCTCTEAKDIVKSPAKTPGKFKKPNLTETVKHFFGENLDGAHNAMVDTTACRRVYFAIKGIDVPKQIAPGLIVETVEDILDRSDADRAARLFAATLANAPQEPVEDALADLRKQVDDAYGEAKLWLDGEPVTHQDVADGLLRLHDALDKAAKLAERERKAAKQPHLDAGAAVDADFAPIRDKADKAAKVLKAAVRSWNDAKAEAIRNEAARVQKAADDAREAAAKLIEEARASNNLQAIEEAEQQRDVATELQDMAAKAAREKPISRIEGARGIGTTPMRWIGHIDADPLDLDATRAAEHALMSHYWKGRRQWLVDVLMDEAQRDIRAGVRAIGGLKITQEKVQ